MTKQELIVELENLYDGIWNASAYSLITKIAARATVDTIVEKVNQLDEPKECEFKFYECTRCGFREEDDYRREEMCFCPNCGAKIKQ